MTGGPSSGSWAPPPTPAEAIAELRRQKQRELDALIAKDKRIRSEFQQLKQIAHDISDLKGQIASLKLVDTLLHHK